MIEMWFLLIQDRKKIMEALSYGASLGNTQAFTWLLIKFRKKEKKEKGI